MRRKDGSPRKEHRHLPKVEKRSTLLLRMDQMMKVVLAVPTTPTNPPWRWQFLLSTCHSYPVGQHQQNLIRWIVWCSACPVRQNLISLFSICPFCLFHYFGHLLQFLRTCCLEICLFNWRTDGHDSNIKIP